MSKQSRISLLAALAILAGCAPAARADLAALSPVADSGSARALGATATTATSATLLLEDARRAGVTSIVELLNGRVAGLRVERRAGGTIALRLRGHGSALYAEPLVMVDGMPIADGAALADFLATIG